MEVTCERCGAHYDLDETLVGPRGTPVLCTSCGHRFRVIPSRAPRRHDPDSSVVWRIRPPEGDAPTRAEGAGAPGEREVRSLQELKDLIHAKEVTERHRIARGDEPFKPLGDIPELAPTFASAETGMPSVAGLPAPDASATAPAPPRMRGPRLDVEATPGTAPARRPAPTRPRPRRDTYRVRRRPRWIGVTVVLTGLVAFNVWAQWNTVSTWLGLRAPEDRVLPFLDRAAEAAAGARPEAWEAAAREYTRATAVDEKDPRVLVGAARVHARWAQALRLEADDAEARAAEDDASARAAAASTRQQARGHAAEARVSGEDAVRLAPEATGARLALAEALRLAGDTGGAREQIARAGATDDPAERGWRARTDAMLAADAAADLAAAVPGLRDAVDAAPEDLDHRLLLARALLAARDVPGARAAVGAVLSRAAGHPRARALLDAMDRGLPPAPPVVEVIDGGEPATPSPTAATRTTGDAEAPGAVADTPDDDGPGEPPLDAGYGWFVTAGDEALDVGDLDLAQERFEAALERRPRGPEAQTGLGWVDLGRQDVGGAATRFRLAAEAGYADAWLGVAEAERRRGDDRAVLEALEAYLARVPNGARAEAARRDAARLRAALEPGDDDAGGEDAADAPAAPAPATAGGTAPADAVDAPVDGPRDLDE